MSRRTGGKWTGETSGAGLGLYRTSNRLTAQVDLLWYQSWTSNRVAFGFLGRYDELKNMEPFVPGVGVFITESGSPLTMQAVSPWRLWTTNLELAFRWVSPFEVVRSLQHPISLQSSAMFFVYMVRCADGTLYTGLARDPEARIKLHNAGKGAKYTRSRLPVSLVYLEACESLSAALRRERQLKPWRKARKEALVLQASRGQ